MSPLRSLAAAPLAALVVLLAACSAESTSPSEAPTDAPSEEPSVAMTEEPTSEPSVGATTGALPSLEPGAGNLADILPEEVGGITLQYQSASGADVLGSGAVTPETQAFFDALGADPSQLSSAFGFGVDVESESVVTVVGFQVGGANSDQLRSEFRDAMTAQGNETTEDNVGGKDVLVFSDETGTNAYVYVTGDIVVVVGGEPPELAEEALSLLP